MARLRVLVVEDSATFRQHLAGVLATGAFDVVGMAGSGPEAIAMCERLRPDVVTLDLLLPGMSGLAVAEHIMAYMPTPILVVSGELRQDERFVPHEALAAGAVDVLDKPRGGPSAAWDQRFRELVQRVSRIRVIRHVRAKLRSPSGPLPPPPTAPAPQAGLAGRGRVVAIGASTGGPSALLTVLQGLPAGFPLPILVVLHIGATVGHTFADWLDGQIPLPARHATPGAALPPPGAGVVLVAPPDLHLRLANGRLVLDDGPERHSCRPSVDVLFESVAHEAGDAAIGCLLTGMGRDGAEGLLAIKRAGGATIAQDEATSVVYGMPREAARLGAASRVLALPRVAPELLALAGVAQAPSGGARP